MNGMAYTYACPLCLAVSAAIVAFSAACTPTRSSVEFAVHSTPATFEGRAGRRLVTSNFELLSDLRDAEFENALPLFLEAAFEQFALTAPPQAGRARRLVIYLFNDRAEWVQFASQRFPERSGVYAKIRSGGFTEENVSAVFFTNRAATLATLAHEAWHQYAAARLKSAPPPWLNEGMACYHESAGFEDLRPRFYPGRNSLRINHLRAALHRGTILPLTELISLDAGQIITRDDSSLTQGYYAQAWTLVTFLKDGPNARYREAFTRLLLDIADGTYRLNASAAQLSMRSSGPSAAFQQYFGVAPEAMQQEYEAFLLKLCNF